MNDSDLKRAMRQYVSATEPPPMSDAPILDAAHRDLRRRRTIWAGGASAAVVALVAVGVGVLAPAGADSGGVDVGAQPSGAENTETTPSGPVSTAERSFVTATAGPHVDRTTELSEALDELAPAGYGTPDDLTGTGEYADKPLKHQQALYDDTGEGPPAWTYTASTPLTRGGSVGGLGVDVFSPNWPTDGEGCAVTTTPWDAGDSKCTEHLVNGLKVAVVDETPPEDLGLRTVQWAGYVHEDGTAVFVWQSVEVPRSGQPALDALPLTAEQLAELAVDYRLKVG